MPSPVVTGLSPNYGPTSGGTEVAITGSGFTGATQVNFGSATEYEINVVNDSTIDVWAPGESAGIVNVTVTTPGGTSSTSSADHYAYGGPAVVPAVTSVSPSSGPLGGETQVQIDGSGFSNATAVYFGGAQAEFYAPSDSVIDVYSPSASAAGAVDVTVVNAFGTSSTSSADQFTYMAPPTVTSISPGGGPTTGGTATLINGSGFTGATGVTFGGVSAPSYQVLSDTQILATSPAYSGPYRVDIQVTTPYGTSASSSGDGFQYAYAAQPTTTTLSSSENPSTYGDELAFTATVSNAGSYYGPQPSGTVTFMDGDTQLGTATLSFVGGSEQATFFTAAMSGGAHNLTAVYNGDALFAASTSGVLPQNVLPAATTTTVSSGASTSAPNQAVAFTAVVQSGVGGTPTGTVTFMYGNTALGTATLAWNGTASQATLIASVPAVGNYAITAVYSGDANWAGSTSAAINQTVRAPTTEYWTDATRDGSAGTPGNWSAGPFVAGDQLVFDSTYAPNSNNNCNFDVPTTDAYGNPLLAGMQVLNNYSGSILFTIPAGFTDSFEDDSTAASIVISGPDTVSALNIYLGVPGSLAPANSLRRAPPAWWPSAATPTSPG